MKHQLELQADRLEAVFLSHKLEGKVWGGQVTARTIRFQVAAPLEARTDAFVRLADEFARSLAVASVRVYRQNAAICIEVPLPGASATLTLDDVEPLAPAALPACTAILGLDSAGKALLLRLTSPDVTHVLIAGMTGSGKTVLLRTALASLARRNPPASLRMVLVDPKGGRGLEPVAAFPHVLGRLVTFPAEAADALAWAVAEMERRHQERQFPYRLIVAIDELADLALTYPAAIDHLTRLAAMGREAGVHLIAGTQRPAASVLSGLLKANFPVRLVGQVASAADATVATGRAGTGAEDLAGRGDFLLVAGGRVIRFQAASAFGESEDI